MRALSAIAVALLVGGSSAPYARHYELERSQSMYYLAGALGIAALQYMGDADSTDGETEGLALAAALPLMRRNIVVLHDVRLSVERLNDLFAGEQLPAFGTSLNVMADLRFRLEDVPRLLAALQLPHSFSTRSRYRFSGVEGFLILLKRMRYPQRLIDLSAPTGRRLSALSEALTVCAHHHRNHRAAGRVGRCLVSVRRLACGACNPAHYVPCAVCACGCGTIVDAAILVQPL